MSIHQEALSVQAAKLGEALCGKGASGSRGKAPCAARLSQPGLVAAGDGQGTPYEMNIDQEGVACTRAGRVGEYLPSKLQLPRPNQDLAQSRSAGRAEMQLARLYCKHACELCRGSITRKELYGSEAHVGFNEKLWRPSEEAGHLPPQFVALGCLKSGHRTDGRLHGCSHIAKAHKRADSLRRRESEFIAAS